MAQVIEDKPKASGKARSAPRSLYERDYYGWVEEQVALLRAGRLSEIDAENIAEELSDMGRSEFAQLCNILRVLVMHMLKWDQQPEHRTPSWIFSIREQRRRYERHLAENSSLKPRLGEALSQAYEDARDWAADETHLRPSDFPETFPYEWADILQRPFDFDSGKK